MKAKEMFEALGYELNETKYSLIYIKPGKQSMTIAKANFG